MEVIPPSLSVLPPRLGAETPRFCCGEQGWEAGQSPSTAPGVPTPPPPDAPSPSVPCGQGNLGRTDFFFFFNPFLTHCTDSCTEHHLTSIHLIPEFVWNERNPSLSLKSLAFELKSELLFAALHPSVTTRPPAPQKPRLELQRSATVGRGVRQGGERHGMEKQPRACGAIGESRPAAPRHATAAAPWATLANYPRL